MSIRSSSVRIGELSGTDTSIAASELFISSVSSVITALQSAASTITSSALSALLLSMSRPVNRNASPLLSLTVSQIIVFDPLSASLTVIPAAAAPFASLTRTNIRSRVVSFHSFSASAQSVRCSKSFFQNMKLLLSRHSPPVSSPARCFSLLKPI